MKKTLVTIFALLFTLPFVSKAQTWSGSTPGNIYYNSGKVGIGTSSPADILTVSGTSPTNGTFITLDDQATSARTGVRLRFQSIGIAHWNVGIPANIDAFTINGWGGSSNPEFFRITSGGNVGIGTTSPGTTLEVNGATTTIPTSISRNSSYGSTNASGTSSIGLYFSNHGAAKVEASKYATNITDMKLYGEYGFNTPSLIMTLHPTSESGGNVGIGTTTPDERLTVKGTIHSQEVKIDMTGWSDYVLKPTYKLPALSTVKTYIEQNSHLPEIPSEEEMVKNGLQVGEMNKLLMKKVEELTLYLIEKDCDVKELKHHLTKQQKELDHLKKQIHYTSLKK